MYMYSTVCNYCDCILVVCSPDTADIKLII